MWKVVDTAIVVTPLVQFDRWCSTVVVEVGRVVRTCTPEIRWEIGLPLLIGFRFPRW